MSRIEHVASSSPSSTLNPPSLLSLKNKKRKRSTQPSGGKEAAPLSASEQDGEDTVEENVWGRKGRGEEAEDGGDSVLAEGVKRRKREEQGEDTRGEGGAIVNKGALRQAKSERRSKKKTKKEEKEEELKKENRRGTSGPDGPEGENDQTGGVATKSESPLFRIDKVRSDIVQPDHEIHPATVSKPSKLSSTATSNSTSKTSNTKSRYILFIGNLPFTATTEQITSHFSALQPTSIRHRQNPSTGLSKGFAFIEFDDYDKMKRCLKGYHGTVFSPSHPDKSRTTGGAKDGEAGVRKEKPRKLNIELTAGGGGGKSEKRKARIKEKNAKLAVERDRIRLPGENRNAADGASGGSGAGVEDAVGIGQTRGNPRKVKAIERVKAERRERDITGSSKHVHGRNGKNGGRGKENGWRRGQKAAPKGQMRTGANMVEVVTG